MDNPFERYDLDPREGVAAITERLKELAEDANDDAARERIRAAWEELTMHPARRLRAALFAHPETRPPLGAPPPRRRVRAPAEAGLSLRDLLARPTVIAALGSSRDDSARGDDSDDAGGPVGPFGPPPSLDDDPLL